MTCDGGRLREPSRAGPGSSRSGRPGAMKHSVERILTTHCGSLPRPSALLDLMKLKVAGEPYDAKAYDQRVRDAVRDSVRRQAASGIDVVTDGEQSKPGFFAYVNERLTGFEPRPDASAANFGAELEAFPEYYEQYFQRAMLGSSIARTVPIACTGPIRYQGQVALQRDIANLASAVESVEAAEVFMPAIAPGHVGSNEH